MKRVLNFSPVNLTTLKNCSESPQVPPQLDQLVIICFTPFIKTCIFMPCAPTDRLTYTSTIILDYNYTKKQYFKPFGGYNLAAVDPYLDGYGRGPSLPKNHIYPAKLEVGV